MAAHEQRQSVISRAARALSTTSRALLLSAALIFPARGNAPLDFSQRVASAAPWSRRQAPVIEEAEEEVVEVTQSGGRFILVKAAAGVGLAAGGAVYARSASAAKEAERKREAEEYLRSIGKSEKSLNGAGAEPGSLQSASQAAAPYDPTARPVAAPPAAQPIVVPPPPPPPPPPLPPPAAAEKKAEKKFGLNIFSNRALKDVPTVEYLSTQADEPAAKLCSTYAWALRAPVDVGAAMPVATGAAAAGAEEELDEDGPAALAMGVLEQLEEARELSRQSGVESADAARCLEQVGRAMLLELVDAAVSALGSDGFGEAASKLCLFARNAEAVALAQGVAAELGEVLYEGPADRRKLEKVYGACLKLAAPELLATMGMGVPAADEGEGEGGVDEAAAGVSVDTVEKLRPLLRIREAKAQRMLQDTLQSEMVSVMGGPGDEKDPTKAMGQSVEMLEQLIDSGSFGAADLAELRKMISQQMGMDVEELLRRREELEKELPPEGKKLFVLIDRLFGEGGGATPAAAAAPPDVELGPPGEGLSDEETEVSVRQTGASLNLP